MKKTKRKYIIKFLIGIVEDNEGVLITVLLQIKTNKSLVKIK